MDDDPRLRLLNTFYARKRKASDCLSWKQQSSSTLMASAHSFPPSIGACSLPSSSS